MNRIGNRSFRISDIFPYWRSNWDKIDGIWIHQKLLELRRLMRDRGKHMISLLSSILPWHMKNMNIVWILFWTNEINDIWFQIATATLGFNVYEIYHASYMLKGLLAEPEVFTDFSDLAGWSKIFQNCAGVSIFLGLIKIFKYISFNKTMSILSGTLTRVG